MTRHGRTAARIAEALAAVLVLVPAVQAQTMSGQMGGTMAENAPVVPPVTGYGGGETVLFLHTEASDPAIADLLTEMMGSPVLVVPALAEIPEAARAPVYVFTNGVRPEGPRGPLGFQPDVFGQPPGDQDYTPLREIVKVTWRDEESARVLTSAAAVWKAARAGEVALEESGIVVNMPMVTWPGGRR